MKVLIDLTTTIEVPDTELFPLKKELEKVLREQPTIEPDPIWHECFDDDPNSFPDDDRNVLVGQS